MSSLRACKKTAPTRKPPKTIYLVWCDATWCAFLNKKTAKFWSEDGYVWTMIWPQLLQK